MSPSPEVKLKEIAEALQRARLDKNPIPQFTSQMPDFSLEDAYTVQNICRESDIGAGLSIAGYKMGLTSKAKQRDVKVFEPISGYLTDKMELPLGQPMETASRIHPRVEPEIAVVMKTAVTGAHRITDLIGALEFVGPAIEILDSRYRDFAFRLPDVVADNTSASGFILGTTNYLNRLDDLPFLGVTLMKNGEVLETGAPAAVLGNPLISLLQLVQTLEKRNQRLEAGQVVLTGGITASISVKAADWIEMTMPSSVIRFPVI
ncbi:MAG: 4-oxalocrotonate decarboxylase [Deltaproteobacteria bacterium]|nr:4-oxalocrotonate decarboxylase [Deltaproteobacteria bacterium]MBI3294590.1 4-oxalocrotonate decarboxylase [Deltaproteobacteria bacterium]